MVRDGDGLKLLAEKRKVHQPQDPGASSSRRVSPGEVVYCD